jgi:hypothetical protein
LDSISAAKLLAEEFGVTHEDAIKAIDAEVDDLRADSFRARKLSYKEALDAAYATIRDWLKTGEQYAVKLEWDDICRFAFSHRKACVWAVLTAKARVAKKAAEHAQVETLYKGLTEE